MLPEILEDIKVKLDIRRNIKARRTYWQYYHSGQLTLHQVWLMMLPSFLRPRELSWHTFPIMAMNQYRVDLIKDGDVVVDGGAFHGVFSIFVAEQRPRSTIYAFEPTPSTFKVLRAATKKYPNIKCFNYALGNENKMTSIVEIRAGKGCANYIGEGGTPIEMRTIDSFGIPMNFLKMDAEASEGIILKGAADTIKKHRPIIAMSAYHKPGDRTELPEILNAIAPYDCALQDNGEEDFVCRPRGVRAHA